MKVRDICGVVEDIYDVYDRVVYYEDIHEYGAKYLGEFSDVKDSIMDYDVCRIYLYDSDCIGIEVTSNNILYTNAKIINQYGKYVNSIAFIFDGNSLSYLVCDNADVKYICYGTSCPESSKNSDYLFHYKEFMEELPGYEKSVTNGMHGKVIMAFEYNCFFINVFKCSNSQAEMLKNYMISNGWVFDRGIDLVYKIIVL